MCSTRGFIDLNKKPNVSFLTLVKNDQFIAHAGLFACLHALVGIESRKRAQLILSKDWCDFDAGIWFHMPIHLSWKGWSGRFVRQ